MPPVSRNQKTRARGFSTFQKAIVRLVRRDRKSHSGHDQCAVLPDLREGFRYLFGQNRELRPAQDGFVFEKDRRGDEKPKATIESKFEDTILKPEWIEVR